MADQAAAGDPQSAGNPQQATHVAELGGGGSFLTGRATEPTAPQVSPAPSSTDQGKQAAPASQPGTEKTDASPKSELPGFSAAATPTLKGNPKFASAVSKFKTFDDFATAYMELESAAGTMVKVPGADATQEERDAFKVKISGAPDSPDKYELGTYDLPDGFSVNDEFAQGFRDLAHTLHLSPEEAKVAYAWSVERSVSTMRAAQAEATAKEQAQKEIEAADKARERDHILRELRKDWGSNAEKETNATIEFVQHLAKTNPTLIDDLNKTGFGNSLAGIRFFAQIAKDYRNHGFVGGDGGGREANAAEAMFGAPMKR